MSRLGEDWRTRGQEQNIASLMTDSSENSEQATKIKNPFWRTSPRTFTETQKRTPNLLYLLNTQNIC